VFLVYAGNCVIFGVDNPKISGMQSKILRLTLVMPCMLFLVSCGEREGKKNASPPFVFDDLGADTSLVWSDRESGARLDPAPTGTVHYGLDISHYQGNIMVRLDTTNELRFVFCKATQGTVYLDPDFRINWHGIRQKGFVRGAYHFYTCVDDPLEQARFFAGQIDDLGPADMPPVLDIEQGGMGEKANATDLQTGLLAFLRELETLTGRRPMIYTNYAFAQKYLKTEALGNYPLWLADYSGGAQPAVPDLWKKKGYKIWQRSSDYTISSGVSDFDVYFGQFSGLLK
jgi:lysozyme